MTKYASLAFCVALLAAGCAGDALFPGSLYFAGRDLVPGKSTAKDVEKLLGKPAEIVPLSGGDDVWFYPDGPDLRFTYAVQMTQQGVLRKVDQRLEESNLPRLVPDSTRAPEARALLGPPQEVTRSERQGRDVWRYRMYDAMGQRMVLDLQFSSDGVLRERSFIRDPKEISGAV